MSFWTSNTAEPKRSYRFKIASTNGFSLLGDKETLWWHAKTATKPSFTVSHNEYQIVNQKFKVPGIVTWDPVTITLVDLGNASQNLVDELALFGWSAPDEPSNRRGLDKTRMQGGDKRGLGKIRIQELSGGSKKDGVNATVIGQWTLEGAFISKVQFGNLDYKSDDIVEITLTFDYDYAIFSQTET